jgi:Domain of Unknown Function (DUF928)
MNTVGELAAVHHLVKSGRISLLRSITVRSITAGALCCVLLHGVTAQSQSAPPPAKSTRVRAKLDGFDIAPTSGKAPNQIGGASRDLGALTLYAPKLAKAYTLTPTFFWSAEDDRAEFTFKLAAMSAQESPIYVKKVTGGKFTYPADAPALKPSETYVWSVQPENDLMGGMASASVLIVGGSNRETVDSALAGAKSAGEPSAAAAKVYVDNRLWFDAIAEYTALIEKHPDMAQYHQARAQLYDQLPATQPLADADASAAAKGQK